MPLQIFVTGLVEKTRFLFPERGEIGIFGDSIKIVIKTTQNWRETCPVYKFKTKATELVCLGE